MDGEQQRYKLRINYRRGGKLLRCGSVVELTDAEAQELGAYARRWEEPPAETEPTPPAPEDPPQADGTDTVLQAMVAADPEHRQEDWWTKDGRPEVAELRRRGLTLNAEQRDAAWAAYQAAQDAA